MRKTVVAALLLAAMPATAARPRIAGHVDPSLIFTFDAGYRVLDATNPAAGIGADGVYWLYYTDHATGRPMVTTSANGLSFGTASVAATWANDSRNTLMPDGKTWRRYAYDPRTVLMTSSKSSDGITFTSESGTCYTPQPQDNATLGVYDAFSDPSGNVVLLYIGDLFGRNNIRRAVSHDGGLTFTFERGNILGDDNAGGGGNSYVDEKTTRLPDGRLRLFTMKSLTIYSFLSIDGGYSFSLEAGARLRPSDFKGGTLNTLNDPVVIVLPDGRFRMYVAALRSDNVWVVVSATSR
jgi:hypothetical protein